jgi:hypothetical protein
LTCPPIEKYLISKEDVRGLTDFAITIVNDLAERGETCDVLSAMAMALDILQHNKKVYADCDREFRGYAYDNQQRDKDRSLEERRHREKQAAGREDNQWLEKLQSERNKTTKALLNAVTVGFVAALVYYSITPLQDFFRLLRDTSYQESTCGRALFGEPVSIDNSSSWAMFKSYSSVYQSRILSIMDCLSQSIPWACSLGSALVTTFVGPWLLYKLIPLPESCKSIVMPVFLAFFSCTDGWFPVQHLRQLGLSLALVLFLAWAGLQYQYTLFRDSFKKGGGTPSVAQVKESTEWFDAARTVLCGCVAMVCVVMAILVSNRF